MRASPPEGPISARAKRGRSTATSFCPSRTAMGRSHFPFDYKRDKPIDYRLADCPNGEKLMRRGFSFGMLPSLDDEDVADISAGIRKVFGHLRKRNHRGI